MSRRAKGPAFKMRSGNSTPFKQMGSQAVDTTGSNTGSSTYNQSYENPQGVTMYRHPDQAGSGLWSSTKYDPAKEGVVHRRIGGNKYDYMGQSIDKTPGEIRQLEGKIRAQVERMKKHERWKKYNEKLDEVAGLGTENFWDKYQPSSGEDFSQGQFTEDMGPTGVWYKSTRG